MSMFKFSRTLFVASLFAVFAFALTGCGGPAKVELSDAEKSPEGVALEDYLPQDTLMMMTVTTQDESQRESFNTLMSYFPQEDMDALWESFMLEMALELEESGLDYEEDIAPIFSDSYRFTFGMAGELEQDEPDMYIAFTVADTEKAKALIEKAIEEDDDAVSGTVLGAMTVDNESDDMYLALYKDTLLITNIAKNRDAAIKRVVKNEASILSNELFMKSYEDLPKPNLGIAYINVNDLFTKLEATGEEEVPSGDFVEALYGEAFAFTATEDGISMIVQVAFDETSEGFNFADYPYEEPYMYKNIPGEKLMIYSEAYGMKSAFDIQMQTLTTDPDSMEEFEEFKMIFKESLGLDFDDDILSWMDKGFALVVQQNKSIIPAISFYVDASSEPEKAQEVLDLIDAAMQQGVDAMLADAPEELDAANILIKDTVILGNSEVNRVAFDVTGLSDEQLLEAGLPSGVFVEPFEIYYGLTDENYFLLSTYSGLDEDYETTMTVAENPMVQDAQKYLEGYPYGLSYISVQEVMNYVDTFVGFMELVEGPMGDDVQAGLDKVKAYIAPIKYLTAGNKQVENIAEGLMFVKMEQPVVEEEVAEE